MTLYILKYNNYYNRIVKYESTLSAYDKYITYSVVSTNFNPNDNIDTTHIIGAGDYDGTGDYVIIYDNGEIISRWFIVESVRTRAGQYQLQLHRDVIVDYYNIIKNSPIFIEKATLSDSDPLIYNNENMSFNQIKQSELLLKDETGCAWIVGYMSSKPYTNGSGQEKNITSTIKYHLPVDEAYLSFEEYPFYRYSDKITASNRAALFSSPTKQKVCIWQKTPTVDTIYQGRKFAFSEYGSENTGILDEIGVSRIFPYTWLSSTWEENFQCPSVGGSMIWENSLEGSGEAGDTMLEYFKRGYQDKFYSIFNLLYTNIGSKDPSRISAENGKKIYFQDTGKYYKVRVEVLESSGAEILPAFNSNLWLTLKEGYDEAVNLYNSETGSSWATLTGITGTPNSYTFSINFEATRYNIYLDEQPEPVLSYEIQIDNNRWHLNDAPYDMFCIPYSDDLVINNGSAYMCTANKELAFQTALALGRDYMGAGYIYDIQLLPYCPVRECIQPDGTFDVSATNHYEIKSFASGQSYINGTVVGTVIFGTTSNFTLNVRRSISLTNKKIQANCDTWRLCSPNYSGLFEFNVAKNNGVDYFNVDCTYKPYNPYIHVNPNFRNMYGYDANDMRGLICGGDFSLPNITDAWKTYELTNKNYQEIFDRQIQSMELNNSIQHSKDIFNAITGSVSGAATGALSGAMMSGGNPYAAIAGGVVGGVASGIGGVLDVQTNQLLRNDALDLTKDQFGYQLGNTKALPYSIAKTSAFTANNKIFPFVEYYSCTNTEKLALANKIAYNGMTVMRIGTFEEFVNNTWSYSEVTSKGYIKGKLIRFNDEGEDFHLVNVIADELNKGVYIK